MLHCPAMVPSLNTSLQIPSMYYASRQYKPQIKSKKLAREQGSDTCSAVRDNAGDPPLKVTVY